MKLTGKKSEYYLKVIFMNMKYFIISIDLLKKEQNYIF
jgi:hypothetical protein